MRRAQQQARPVRTAAPRSVATAARVGRVGTAVVVTVGITLTAITERSLLAGGANGATRAPGGTGGTTGAAPSGHGDPAAKRPAAPAVTTLAATVRSLTLAQRGAAARKVYGAAAAPPLVGATRLTTDKAWAFGTTAIPVPAGKSAMPQVYLYIAHWTSGKWRISLSGSSQFAGQLKRAPTSLIPAAERRVLTRYDKTTRSAVAVASPTASASPSPSPSASPSPAASLAGLTLPWKQGAIWTLGSAGPAGTLSFRPPVGGVRRVLAAARGRIYRFCSTTPGRGMVLVVHDSGIASEYYDLTGVTGLRDGAVVNSGDFLGKAGNDRPCGGKSGPAQVLFGLRGAAADLSLNGVTIGGWTFQDGQAVRGLLQVPSGGPLANFGLDPTTSTSPSVRLSGPRGLLPGTESPSPTGK